MSRRHDQATRRRIVEQWDKSGVPARKFAARAGVSHWTLYTWRRDLRRRGRFVELVPEASLPAARPVRDERDPALEIALPGGIVVRVGRDVDEALLRRVVLALT